MTLYDTTTTDMLRHEVAREPERVAALIRFFPRISFHPLTRTRVMQLGRSLDPDVVLDDRGCSRAHAVVNCTSAGPVIHDLGS